MSLDKNLPEKLSIITSKAAISTFSHIGKRDKISADKAAVDTMRNELNKLNIDGKIVIGEGELDEAPMLYIGEKVGNIGPSLDIAVDPVEGTNFVANNLPGSLSVIAVAEKGNLFNAPETYMEKIAVNHEIPNDAIDLDYSIEKNLSNLSDIKNVNISDLTVCLLDRPRHNKIVDELKRLKANIKFITDGDIAGALYVTNKKYNVDMYFGIGGGPEGVLAACALDSYNCYFQGRFLFKKPQDKNRAKKMGIVNLYKKYEINEIVKGESIFCATGITDGDLVNGVKLKDNMFITQTLVTQKNISNNIIINKLPST